MEVKTALMQYVRVAEWQTRSAKDAISQGVEVRVLLRTPLFLGSKEKPSAKLFI